MSKKLDEAFRHLKPKFPIHYLSGGDSHNRKKRITLFLAVNNGNNS